MTPREHAGAYYLARLHRLLEQRQSYYEDLAPKGHRLFEVCIRATERDCREYGTGIEAAAALKAVRQMG